MSTELYRKFLESGQEPQKLKIALQRFFEEDLEESWKERYEGYLKQRIRPAAEQLIRLGEVTKIQKLVEKDWLSRYALEECIMLASRERQTEIQLLLMEWKKRKFGFSDREYRL